MATAGGILITSALFATGLAVLILLAGPIVTGRYKAASPRVKTHRHKRDPWAR